MKIYVATHITEEIADAFQNLIPQLSPGSILPKKADLEKIVKSGNTRIIIAEEEKILGTLTLVFQKIPTGEKVWIEDVIVDNAARGKGIGEKLMLYALDYIRKKGIKKIDLTSVPERIAANRLYQKLGFEKRNTNIYRFTIKNTNTKTI